MHLPNEPETRQFFTLAGGDRGIFQTAQLMRQLVDEYKVNPEIRGLALSLVRPLEGKNEMGEINSLFHFVRDQIRYVKDIYNVETLHTPTQLLKVGQGDCDDKSTLLAALLESIGYQTMFKLCAYDGNDFQHVYTFVIGTNIALHLDPTELEDAGWEPPNPRRWVYVA